MRHDIFWVYDARSERLVSMQRVATTAGVCYHDGETQLAIHPKFGSWLGFRACVVVDAPSGLGASQAGALAALADQDFVKASREENARVRAGFVARMAQLGNRGVSTVPSEANFVLVFFPDQPTAERVRDSIAEAGYAVRHLPGQGLGEGLRITIGREDDMARVADAIEAELAD